MAACLLLVIDVRRPVACCGRRLLLSSLIGIDIRVSGNACQTLVRA